MGKPTICIGENKDADQLRGNREADQRLCFRYTDSTIPLLSKSKIPSSTLIRLRICVITQLKYEKTQLITILSVRKRKRNRRYAIPEKSIAYRFLSVCAAQRLTPSTLNKNVIGHAQIDRLEAISFLFFRWLTAILVKSLNQSMFPFYLMLCKSESRRK